MAKKKKIGHWTMGDYINVFFLVLIAFVTFYPFWNVLMISLNDPNDTLMGGITLWIRKFTIENYRYIFTQNAFTSALIVSVGRTSIGAAAHLLFCSAFAYALSKKWMIGQKFFLGMLIVTMYIGGGLIPTYILIKNLGLLDNFLVYIVPGMWGFYNCLLIMAYLRGNVDSAIEESAHIDGAGPFRTLASIIFPVSLPVIASIALFCAVGQWNSWFDTVIYTKSDNLETLQSMLMKLVKEAENIKSMVETMSAKGQNVDFLKANIQPNGIRVATMLVVILPIVCVYPFLQKYFVKGIMIGAVKG